jgi:hypothetical protein
MKGFGATNRQRLLRYFRLTARANFEHEQLAFVPARRMGLIANVAFEAFKWLLAGLPLIP